MAEGCYVLPRHLDLSQQKTRYTLKSGTKTPILQEEFSSRTTTDLYAMFI
jgi:hypothetical protein